LLGDKEKAQDELTIADVNLQSKKKMFESTEVEVEKEISLLEKQLEGFKVISMNIV
jgi:hypothetical protein